ncbi:hypothetical protein AB8A28_05385 [Tardiphaga sp. 71_E8_N1_1]|uniref:hypothetical protein n=1 Tax=Tardiphaga sp. 71_E8_N1_1 TaxID=3240784 RepID=UPI003F8B6A2D
MVDAHRKLRFSDVAAAIESTPKALRKMLDSPQLVLLGSSSKDSDDSKWQDFSLLQISALAISRRLIEFGASIGVSSGRASASILELYLSLFNLRNVDEEVNGAGGPQLGTFLDHISGSHLVVTNDENGGQHEVLSSVALKKRYPSWSLDRAILVVPIGPVVSRAIARALLGSGIDSSGNERSALIPFGKIKIPIHTAIRPKAAPNAKSKAESSVLKRKTR